MYHLNQFYMYNLLVLSIFTLLCNQNTELFHLAKLEPYPH